MFRIRPTKTLQKRVQKKSSQAIKQRKDGKLQSRQISTRNQTHLNANQDKTSLIRNSNIKNHEKDNKIVFRPQKTSVSVNIRPKQQSRALKSKMDQVFNENKITELNHKVNLIEKRPISNLRNTKKTINLQFNKDQANYNLEQSMQQQQNKIQAVKSEQLNSVLRKQEELIIQQQRQIQRKKRNEQIMKQKQRQQELARQKKREKEIRHREYSERKEKDAYQQKKRQQEASQQIEKIKWRRAQRQRQKKRIQQIQQKRKRQVEVINQRISQNDNNLGVMYTNDPLSHFQYSDSLIDVQVANILQKQELFSNLKGPIKDEIMQKRNQLKNINQSYMMIRDDSASNSIAQGLNGYRIQMINKIGQLLMQAQSDANQNGINFIEVDPRVPFRNLPDINLTRGIQKSKIKHFVKSIKCQDQDCPICLGNLEGEEGNQLKCGHVFHPKCLQNWLQTNANCPSCRHNVKFS